MSNSSPTPDRNIEATNKASNKSPSQGAKDAKKVNEQTTAAKKDSQKQPSTTPSSAEQRTVKCPSCSELNKIKVKNGGKYMFSLTFPFTKFTLNIPNPLAFFGKVVTLEENLKDGKKCARCQGKKKVVDVTDDTAKYKEARQYLEQEAQKITELESRLGEGGNETVNIQGSYFLNVGSEFNRNNPYTMEKDGGSVPIFTGNTNSPQGEQKPTTAVTGKQAELGWPQHIGNFIVKCGNKFRITSGGGGITFSTKGPLTLEGGIIRFIGPSLTLGSQDGPLTLEGETVTIGGKDVVVAPTGGQTYFRGTVAATGNAVIAGHTHSEGLSFIRATCPGVNKESSMDQANKDTTKTEAAIWSYKATASSILELLLYVQAIPSSVFNSKRIVSVEGLQSLIDRIAHITKLAMPLDNNMMPTGICIVAGSAGLVYNFPHHHGIPNLHHTHNTKVADITLEDTPEAVRGKVYNGALTGGAPANLTEDGGARKLQGLLKIAESTYGLLCEGFNLISRLFKTS